MAKLLKTREKRISDSKACLKDFEVFKLAQGVCETTLKEYRWHLGRFFNEFPDVWGDNEELRWAVIKYFANGNNLAPAIYNIRQKYLKAFYTPKGWKTEKVRDVINHMMADFTIQDIQERCPGISRSTVADTQSIGTRRLYWMH